MRAHRAPGGLAHGCAIDRAGVQRSSDVSRAPRAQHAIGTSVGGKTIWAVEVSKDIDRADDMLKANFRYVGNVHGDEPLGRQILPALGEYATLGTQ